MRGSIPFEFEVPVAFFEKADAPEGQQRRIGGIVSTESKDRQGEVILQRGLDFTPFVQYGWFNDNHSKGTTDILGYPDKVTFVRKGQPLPDGTHAKADGHWAEGYLLKTRKADEVWETGLALQGTGRRLGYSIEGSVEKRVGPDGKVIAAAKVRNVAITNCPVNGDARLEILAKSLAAVEASDDVLLRALGMGTATPGQAVVGPRTGMGAGQILTPQSLETDDDPPEELEFKKEKKVKKALTHAEAVAWVRARLPVATAEQARRIVEMTIALKQNGTL